MKNEDIKVGMLCRYAPEWRRPEEAKYLHIVTESYPDVNRHYIRTINSFLSIGYPKERVGAEMLEWTGFMLEDLERFSEQNIKDGILE